MCAEVQVEPDGRTVGTVGELAALVGGRGRVVVRGIDSAKLADWDCLCPVDLAATAAGAGFVHEDDPFGAVWRRAAEPPGGQR